MDVRGDAGDGCAVTGVTGSGWVEGPRGIAPGGEDSAAGPVGRTAVPGGGCAGRASRRDQRAVPGIFVPSFVTPADDEGKSLSQSS
jgi:hypothetical protein